MMKNSRNTVLLSVFILLLASCSSPEKDWQLAQRDDSKNAYLEFLAKHPDSAFADNARQRLKEIEVIRAWERAEFKDALNSYQAFLDNYGDSEYAERARNRIWEIQRDERWEIVHDNGSKSALKAFIAEYPQAPQLDEARSMLEALAEAEEAARPKERPGNFRLQLAAFRTVAAAEKELRRIVTLSPDILLGPVRIEGPGQGGGNWFVLKTVPMNGDEARKACAALKKLGQQCLIVNR